MLIRNLLLTFEENPQTPTTVVVSILRILKTNKYHPYKIQLHQKLNEDDPDHKLELWEILMNEYQQNPIFPKNIPLSEKATYTLHGTVTSKIVVIGVRKTRTVLEKVALSILY